MYLLKKLNSLFGSIIGALISTVILVPVSLFIMALIPFIAMGYLFYKMFKELQIAVAVCTCLILLITLPLLIALGAFGAAVLVIFAPIYGLVAGWKSGILGAIKCPFVLIKAFCSLSTQERAALFEPVNNRADNDATRAAAAGNAANVFGEIMHSAMISPLRAEEIASQNKNLEQHINDLKRDPNKLLTPVEIAQYKEAIAGQQNAIDKLNEYLKSLKDDICPLSHATMQEIEEDISDSPVTVTINSSGISNIYSLNFLFDWFISCTSKNKLVYDPQKKLNFNTHDMTFTKGFLPTIVSFLVDARQIIKEWQLKQGATRSPLPMSDPVNCQQIEGASSELALNVSPNHGEEASSNNNLDTSHTMSASSLLTSEKSKATQSEPEKLRPQTQPITVLLSKSASNIWSTSSPEMNDYALRTRMSTSL